MQENLFLEGKITEELSGKRLDQALAALFPNYSRTLLQTWIEKGNVRIKNRNTLTNLNRTKVQTEDEIEINAQVLPTITWIAQSLPLNVIYEDADIIVINKPAGLVVHPAPGNPDSTLLNSLLNFAPKLANLPRAGIIHRLDKDTSGLLVIARSLRAYTKLVHMLQKHKIKREYEAIVNGFMIAGGSIEEPIDRDPRNRLKMAVVINGKPAVTHYRVIKKFSKFTHIKVMLETGRTHQIRVHMAYLGYPVVGDKLYGKKENLLSRQALHAKTLGLEHPITGKYLEWTTLLPEDMQQLLTKLS